MNRSLTSLKSLTAASIKMYFRNKAAIFFTLFLPLMFIAIFGFLSQSGGATFSIGVDNQSTTPLAAQVVGALKKVEAFKLTESSQPQLDEKLGKGKIDLEVIIPADFGRSNAAGQLQPSRLIAHYNQARPQNGQAANLVLGQILSGLNAQITRAPQLISVQSSGVQTSNLGSIDFLLPGILAMSIMQLGVFSVAFAFVSMKAAGMLRRLQATPTHPVQFVAAQAVTRLIVGLLQVILLTVLGIWLFHFHLIGNIFEFLLIAILGTLVFLSLGFIVAGWAKDENQAAPIANLVSFPMLFLSGTFFPRDAFPAWLKTITDYFPLTYLTDALRTIANEGAHLAQISGDLLGLAVWGVVLFIIAVRVFRWE